MGHHLLRHPHTPSSISPPVADPPPSATNFTRLNSDSHSSSITVDAFPSHPCLQLGAVQTQWTDDKHRSYVNSLEASFVQELLRNRRLRALSSKQKMHGKPIVMPKISSLELMVLQDASWLKANSGRNDPLLDSTADSPAILEDLLINSLPSARKQSPDLLDKHGSCFRRHLRYTTKPCRSTRSSQQMSLGPRYSITTITEVSDQNFEDNHPGEGSCGMPIAKRLKKATSESLGNDQVVPYRRLSAER